jgi:RimJ/RimL family protein N-acetyltransferase
MKIVYQGKTKTGKDIIIRYPEISDLEEMLKFINTVSDEKTFITYQGEHETLESERKYLKKRLEDINNKKVVHLLAFYGDELIGLSDIKIGEKTEKHIGLLGLIIAKNFRGEGIGKILMGLVEDEAKINIPGIKIIILEVYSTNDIARGLYKKMGFVEYGTLPNGISRNGKFEDAVLMYKNI